MADLYNKIQKKYGIDINNENVFKLYKIENADISESELSEMIESTRKRWISSVNGANEKNAERDRARLEKAYKYEELLKDKIIRKELYLYYNTPKAQDSLHGDVGESGIEFAKKYFSVILSSKKIKKNDVEFFFEYFPSERRNKKEIVNMLESEFKVNKIGSSKEDNDEKTVNTEEKKHTISLTKPGIEFDDNTTDNSSPIVVNLFKKETLLKLQKCEELYEVALQKQDVVRTYPKMEMGLFDFLELKKFDDIDLFKENLLARGKEVYSVRQEKGSEFIPLVDLFNWLQNIVRLNDVKDNYAEFKLLIKYAKLTPYMYSISEMKKGTFEKIVDIARSEYGFRNDIDFVLNYYDEIYDNFGIINIGINGIISRAKKNARRNKFLNAVDEKLGRKSKKLSIFAEIVHFLVYLPLYILYLVYEVVKMVFTKTYYLRVPVGIVSLVLVNVLGEKLLVEMTGIRNVLYLRNILSKDVWYEYLRRALGTEVVNGFVGLFLTIVVIIMTLGLYVLTAVFLAMVINYMGKFLCESYDWVGISRTFKKIFDKARKKSENLYVGHKMKFYGKSFVDIVTFIVACAVIWAIIYFVPIGFSACSEATGYFK